MKAVILSAGQGRRLLPLTAKSPKCMVRINGQSILEWQIDELAKCGIEQATVVVGYEAHKVQRRMHRRYGPSRVRTLYNPDYAEADNLVSCWKARDEMTEDFILLNGDTLFEASVLQRLLNSPVRPVTLVTDHKINYDADDMKVVVDGGRVVRIGKDLAPEKVNGESIGMLLFRGEGPALFRIAMEQALREPSARKKWYLSVIDQMAQSMPVWTCSVQGLRWAEVDYPADLKQAQQVVEACASTREFVAAASPAWRVARYGQIPVPLPHLK